MAKIVYLSASTQEKNRGVGSYGTEELRMNQVADVIERVLKQHSITVFRNHLEMPLVRVVSDSNSKSPDIHLAVHSNAGGSRGCEVFCNRYGGDGEVLAKLVYAELSPLTPTLDRGVREGINFYGSGKHLYELAYTKAPAALVEIAFHDNIDDVAWIINNIEWIGVALARGVLKYLDIPFHALIAQRNLAERALALLRHSSCDGKIGPGEISQYTPSRKKC